MLLAYFDEVKFQPGSQPYYWLGGLVVDAVLIKQLEAEVDALARDCFGTSTLGRHTELHAAEIFHRKRNFKDWPDIGKRLTVLKCLASIIGSQEGIGRIYARLDPAKMLADDHLDQKAFTFFIERVERYLRSKNDLGMLIGDRESEKVATVFAEALSRYREYGTSYAYGTSLQCLIDTVRFTESHLSRMLQLADAYVWFLQLCAHESKKLPAAELVAYVRDTTALLSPHRYKEWPTDQSWIKVPT